MTPISNPAALDAWRHRPGHAWVFKHSRTCPVSAAALTEVAEYERAHPEDPVGVIIVQEHREASAHAEASFRVKHESPQIFLLKNGNPIWNASHDEVTRSAMEMQRVPGL